MKSSLPYNNSRSMLLLLAISVAAVTFAQGTDPGEISSLVKAAVPDEPNQPSMQHAWFLEDYDCFRS
jgi:hypothetical protein